MQNIPLKYVFFSFIIALTFPLVSCDSGGSNGNSTPDWVGNWEVIDLGGDTGSPEHPLYYDLNEERLVTISDEGSGCRTSSSEILESDGGTLTLSIPEGTQEVQPEVSGDILTLTVLENDERPETVGNEITAEAIESDPRDLAGCQ